MKGRWHIAPTLDVLLAELNAAAPQRSKLSDGGIGDARHSNKTSDHNPCPCCETVCARDFTHDPKHGLDCQQLADFLEGRALAGDPRIKYVIWRRQIMSGPGQRNPVGVWRPYRGTNAHTKHLHLSVRHEDVDDSRSWDWPPEPVT
jgi:hypothetical protein